MFIDSRGKVPQPGLYPLSVVENLNIFSNLPYRLFSGCISFMIDKLILQCAPEALHGGVVITVPFSAHGDLHMKLMKEGLIVLGTILLSPVGMMDKSRSRFLPCHRHRERLYDEVLCHT